MAGQGKARCGGHACKRRQQGLAAKACLPGSMPGSKPAGSRQAACLAASRQAARQARQAASRQGSPAEGRRQAQQQARQQAWQHGSSSRHGIAGMALQRALQRAWQRAWQGGSHCAALVPRQPTSHCTGPQTPSNHTRSKRHAGSRRRPGSTHGRAGQTGEGAHPGEAACGGQSHRQRRPALRTPPPKPYQPQAGRVSGRRPPVPHGGADRLLATGRAGGGGAASTGGAWRGRGLQGCKERRQWDTPADNRRARRCRGAERSSEKERPARPGVKDGGDGQRGARQTSGCMYRIAAAASSATRGSEPTTRRNLPRREFELAATHEDRKVDNRQRTSARKQKGRAAPGWQPPDHPRGPELEGGGGGSGGLGYQI